MFAALSAIVRSMSRNPMKPRPTPRQLTIPESELSFSTARSSGPGGQNVNKVETKVTVTFDYLGSRCLSWEQKGRLGRHPAVQGSLDASGMISVVSQRHRSQLLNRADAVQKLQELVRQAIKLPKKRIPTTKTRASQRRRFESKQAHGERKRVRRKVRSEADE